MKDGKVCPSPLNLPWQQMFGRQKRNLMVAVPIVGSMGTQTVDCWVRKKKEESKGAPSSGENVGGSMGGSSEVLRKTG